MKSEFKKYIESELRARLLSTRVFTYDQLVQIVGKNVSRLNRNIDTDRISKSDLFIGAPTMIHEYAFGKPVKPHLRVHIEDQYTKALIGFQDMTFDQYIQGRMLE